LRIGEVGLRLNQRGFSVARRDSGGVELQLRDWLARLQHVAAPNRLLRDARHIHRRDSDILALDIADDDVLGRRAERREGGDERELAEDGGYHAMRLPAAPRGGLRSL
jgi:hypothetical protein